MAGSREVLKIWNGGCEVLEIGEGLAIGKIREALEVGEDCWS